jgi:hypothetical protein
MEKKFLEKAKSKFPLVLKFVIAGKVVEIFLKNTNLEKGTQAQFSSDNNL